MRALRLQFLAACLWAGSGALAASPPAGLPSPDRSAARGGPRATPAPQVSPSDRLAAESLRESVHVLLYSPADTPARAGRILALARLADRLQPGHPDTNWLLAGIYQAQGKESALVQALGECLAAEPNDYLLGLRYLRLNLDMLDTADRRLDYLRSFARRDDVSVLLRAEAHADMGQILRGQGRPVEANSAFQEALRLDPAQPDALQGDLDLRKDAAPAPRLQATLAILRGSPRRIDLALQAGTLLEELGLYTEALVFFDHAWIMADLTVDRGLQQVIAPRYCNAMLAAGESRGAINTFVPKLGRMPSPDLLSLLIEAYSAEGDAPRASQAREELSRLLRDRYLEAARAAVRAMEPAATQPAAQTASAPSQPADAGATPSPGRRSLSAYSPWALPPVGEMPAPEALAVAEAACDLAWFYADTDRRDPNLALFLARQAAAGNGEDPVVQRVLGAAELQARQAEAGLARLRPLVEKDAYAARLVADYHFDSRRATDPNVPKDPNLARAAIRDGVKAGRSGPAFRQLDSLARARGEDIPLPIGKNEGSRAYKAFDLHYLEMPRDPNKYISVRLRSDQSVFPPGEAIAVEAVLTNLSNYEVPVGDWGLVNPRLGLIVKVWGIREPFENLPVLSWPVPRQLPPGATYTARASLAVGALGRLLAQRPLEDFGLEVSAPLDPVQRGTRIDSSLPNLAVPTVSLTRRALVDVAEANTPEKLARACSTQLGRLVYNLQSGSVQARLQAVRQTAELLALQRNVELSRTTLPKPVADALPRGTLLRMVVEALKDPSEAVRAELLTALQLVPLDGRIVALLAPAIEDPSPLVRLRLAELLGASGLPGQRTILDYLAKDRDEAVRLMVAAFSHPKGRG